MNFHLYDCIGVVVLRDSHVTCLVVFRTEIISVRIKIKLIRRLGSGAVAKKLYLS